MSETPDNANPFASVTWPESYPDATESADNCQPAVVTLPDATQPEKAVSGANMDTVMRACNKADESAHATGTEAQVCADIAKRQRRGLAKYGKTVIGNQLSFAQWLQHFYEELLDGAIYAKRILTTMNHEPENENQSDASTSGVLPDSSTSVHRHRKPGAGRKAKPCPGCGAVKSIGSTVKNGIPTRRCRQCGHVVQTYPHLANGKAAE